MRSILLALGLLTRLPLPRHRHPAPAEAGGAAAWFPLAGAVVGLFSALIYLAAVRFFEPLAATALAVLAGLLFTGALHLDGLADTADGLAAGGDEKALAAMRDPRVGSAGALAVAASLLLKVAFLSELGGAAPLALFLAPVLGRWGMVLAMPPFPYARPEGGLGEAFARHTTHGHALWATFLAVLAVALPYLMGAFGSAPGDARAAARLLLVAGAAATLGALYLARRLGGLTGDTYGALNEWVEVVTLAVWAAK